MPRMPGRTSGHDVRCGKNVLQRFVFRNVERLCLKGIDIRGQESEAIDAADVDVIIREVQE